MNTNAKRRINKKNVAAVLLLAVANMILFLTIWLLNKYDKICLDQVLFQMKSSAAGANRSIMNSAYVRVIGFGIMLTLIEVFCFYLLNGRLNIRKLRENEKFRRFCSFKVCRVIVRRALPLAMVMLLISSTVFVTALDVADYLIITNTESSFIEEHYVSPEDVTITFPEQKRNLIYIFLESMENTFGEPEAGGNISANFIDELTTLADSNVNFSNDSGFGGALSYNGTTWTAAALVAQTSGVVVKVPLTADNYGGDNAFIPGVVSIGEILEDAGYQQTLLVGSDADFGGRATYFTEHGNYNIIDIKSLKADGVLPEDYDVWWGFEDAKLFDYAREEVLRLAESGEPFNFTMLTADTHFPNGYQCPDCGTEHDSQYGNVLACSSKRIVEFVHWIQQQDFYENTTIVLVGDHLTMDPNFMEGLDENYVRTIYNCFINAPVDPVNEKNRQFATFDMMPTTLAALGVQIEGDRLALGTNLFSAQQTLTEIYGFEMLDEELQKKSTFYNTVFLEMPSFGFGPNTESSDDKIQNGIISASGGTSDKVLIEEQ